MSYFKTYLEASKHIQEIYTLAEIHKRWNNSDNGKHAKLTTVKRWLNNGPYTKNPRFEPWIENWANREVLNSATITDVMSVVMDVKSTVDQVANQLRRLAA